jgi:hypothetical protein
MHDAILGSGRDTFLVAIPSSGRAICRAEENWAPAPSALRCGLGWPVDSVRSGWQALEQSAPEAFPLRLLRKRSVWNATALGEWNGVRGAEDCEHGFQ